MAEFPTLSSSERDRRWRKVRLLVSKRNLSGLLVFGLGSRIEFDRYLTNDLPGGVVVFPVGRDPIALTWTMSRLIARLNEDRNAEASWVGDLRVGITGAKIVEVLNDCGITHGDLGVAGLSASEGGTPDGFVPFKTWDIITKSLPRVKFVDVTREFAQLMLVESEEEKAVLRRSGEIGELACRRMLAVTEAGVRESDVFAEVAKTIFQNRAHGNISGNPLLMQSGPENPGWGPPTWLYRGGTPGKLRAGGLLKAEIFANYGGMETQQQMSISLKPSSGNALRCARVAEEAYEVGLKALGRRRRFSEVAQDMEDVVGAGDCWHVAPLIHTLNPHELWSSAGAVGIDQLPGAERDSRIAAGRSRGGELEIKPGMVFALQGNACIGRTFVIVGGSVLLTTAGPEELNRLPTKMRTAGR